MDKIKGRYFLFVAIILVFIFSTGFIAAEWTSSMDTNLIGYWSFQNNTFLDYSGHGYDLTNAGSSSENGIIGDGRTISADGSQSLSYYDSDGAFVFASNDFTINLWVNQSSQVGDILLRQDDGAGGWGIFEDDIGNQFYASGSYVTNGHISCTDQTNGIWHMLTLIKRGNNLTFWENGVACGSSYATDVPAGSDDYLRVGGISGGQYHHPVDAIIDEISINNGYAWNDTEINNAWNDGLGLTHEIIYPDTIPPTTTEPTVIPQNPQLYSTLYCNATLTDNDETSLTAHWRWYKNDEVYSSGITQVTNSTNSLITTLNGSNVNGGESWRCEVIPRDSFLYGEAKNSSSVRVLSQIIFNVTDSYYGTNLNYVNISCNSTNFSQGEYLTNPYGPYIFPVGEYWCAFSGNGYYDQKINLTTDSDKAILVPMSTRSGISIEEHYWLEWLYNCWSNGHCSALLENINQTTTQIWQQLTETNMNVVSGESIFSDTLDTSSNQDMAINYTVNIPYKSDVGLNEMLPIRIYYWFTNNGKTVCYTQNKTTATTNSTNSSYCLPLVVETFGPNGGTTNFQVDLSPALPAGTYNVIRGIEIDPLGVWTQYGRGNIGTIKVTESNSKAEIGLTEQTKIPAEKTGITSITGAVVGAVNYLLSGWQIVAVIAVIGFVIVAFIISRTMIRLKKM